MRRRPVCQFYTRHREVVEAVAGALIWVAVGLILATLPWTLP